MHELQILQSATYATFETSAFKSFQFKALVTFETSALKSFSNRLNGLQMTEQRPPNWKTGFDS